MNFGSMNFLTGVSENILEFGGSEFIKHTEALIKKLGKLI